MLEHHQDHAAERFVKHRKRAPQVVAAAGTNEREVLAAARTTEAAAAAADVTTIRGHISIITEGGTVGRVWISPSVVTLSDTAAMPATTTAVVPTTTARTTTAARVTTTSARTTTAARAATSSSAAADTNNAIASSSSSSRTSSSARTTNSSTTNAANNASSKDSDSSSGVSGGAIAGIIIALIAVAALAAGFFFWRRKRNARLARGSGTGLIGGRSPDMAGAAGGAGSGGYKKQHETADSELFANSSASPMWGGEKPPQQEYGATSNNAWAPSATQTQQAERDSFVAPSFASYPASSAAGGQGWPNSSANLLGAGVGAGVGAGAAAAAAPRAMSPFADPQHESIEQREMQQELENQRQAQVAAAAAAAAAAAPPTPVVAVASPFGESEGQGEIRVVKGTFVPNLEDELIFEPGDRIQVLMKYDDGWALGINLSAGTPAAKGVFPFDCLGEVVGAPSAAAPAPANARAPSPLPAPVHPSLQPGQPQPATKLAPLQPVNPADVPLPPPTPTGLTPISEGTAAASAPVVSASAPQLAPLALDRNDSPLSASFPAHAAAQGPPTALAPTKSTKRASSLIASRDADLFVALGEVLDKKEEGQKVQQREDESLI